MRKKNPWNIIQYHVGSKISTSSWQNSESTNKCTTFDVIYVLLNIFFIFSNMFLKTFAILLFRSSIWKFCSCMYTYFIIISCKYWTSKAFLQMLKQINNTNNCKYRYFGILQQIATICKCLLLIMIWIFRIYFTIHYVKILMT